ncbi:MAG: carbon-nitrogen hydrolase family protein [Candidatus Sulfotelmatobacter sp.]
MPGDTYPKFRAAAVQAAPVFLDRDATIDKLETLVQKAVDAGADLIVFGESFIPAFPVWNLIYAPMDQHGFCRRMFDNAVQVPGPHTRRLSEIAKRHRVFLSVGVTEKGPLSMGTLFNTNLLFDREGTLLNRHRKLVPTWAEKLTWANGDAAYLRPEETEIGRVGTLICGENTNTLARFALLAQGEQVHIATYPPAWPFHRPGSGARNYNLAEAIRLRSAAHAFEGKVFNIVASCALDADAIEQLSQGDSKMKELLRATPAPVSIIVGPDGEALADPVTGGEGMVVADIDLAESIDLKMMHDIVGHYNRFDIFHLEVDPAPNQPVSIKKVTRRDEQGSNGTSRVTLQVAAEVVPDEAASPANERPIAVVRAKAQ